MQTLLVSLIGAILALTALAAESKVTVADLAFMAGHWRTSAWGGEGDEIWTSPENGNMIALWRFMKDGKLVFTEHISIEQDPALGPVMRIKHFNPGMKGREEKDESLVLPLEKFARGDAQFASVKDGKRTTIRYRAAEGGRLECTLARTGAGGKPDETVFRFTRRK